MADISSHVESSSFGVMGGGQSMSPGPSHWYCIEGEALKVLPLMLPHQHPTAAATRAGSHLQLPPVPPTYLAPRPVPIPCSRRLALATSYCPPPACIFSCLPLTFCTDPRNRDSNSLAAVPAGARNQPLLAGSSWSSLGSHLQFPQEGLEPCIQPRFISRCVPGWG